MTPSTPEQGLSWEAENRPRAGAAGILGGLLTLLGTVLLLRSFDGSPRVLLTDALREASGRPVNGGEGLLTPSARFLADELGGAVLPSVLVALGALATGLLLGYLHRAVRHRNPSFGKLSLIAAIVGAVMAAVGNVVFIVALDASLSSYVSGGELSSAAARDAFRDETSGIGRALREFSVLPLGLGFVMIAINAMRVGLLTRFMGILGAIVGVLLVVPIDRVLGLGAGLPIVQSFWLIAAGVLVLGVSPRGRPPAWETGRAEPWPTQQELREAREGAAETPAPAPARSPAAPAAGGASRTRKKRKRR